MPLRALGQVGLISRAAKRRQRVSKQGSLDTSDLSPLRGSITRDDLTQGSQSLALGLTLIAAPQLNEFLVKAEME